MISFIVPAHNEELWIGKCLASIKTAMQELEQDYEMIVVDDASTDSTPQIAADNGARVVRVGHRCISATRNAGARSANGEVLFFVDADTQANEQAMIAALDALRAGAAGGGCVFEFDRALPFWGRITYPIAIWLGRLMGWVGGCFLFCTRDAYYAAGGFSERLYCGEDIAFTQTLRKMGKFVIPRPTVITSGRKLDVVGAWEAIPLLLSIFIRGPHHEKKDKLDFLYGKRAQDCKKQNGRTATRGESG